MFEVLHLTLIFSEVYVPCALCYGFLRMQRYKMFPVHTYIVGSIALYSLATETLCCDVAVVFQTNVVRTKYWIIVLIMKPNAQVVTSVTVTVYSKWKVKVNLEANTHSLQA